MSIAKGKTENLPESLRDHYVDGISGATLTGRYLSEGLEETLTQYEPFRHSSEKGPNPFRNPAG